MVQGHFRSVWPRDVAVRRGPGLGGRHSIGQLRNGRQAMLEPGQDHMRAGAEQGAWLLLEYPLCPCPTHASPAAAHHHTGVSPALSGWFCTLGVQPSGHPSPCTPTPSSHTMSNLCM